jgi:hypothetical protein
MDTKSISRVIIPFLLLGATALGLNNTYGDNSDVIALAQKSACGRPGCGVTITRESRSPFSQEYSFQTRLIKKGENERSATVDVECRRAYLLFGDWSCHPTSGGIPGVVATPPG